MPNVRFKFQPADRFVKAFPTLQAMTMSIRATSSQKVWKRLQFRGCRNLIDFLGRFYGYSGCMVRL